MNCWKPQALKDDISSLQDYHVHQNISHFSLVYIYNNIVKKQLLIKNSFQNYKIIELE